MGLLICRVKHSTDYRLGEVGRYAVADDREGSRLFLGVLVVIGQALDSSHKFGSHRIDVAVRHNEFCFSALGGESGANLAFPTVGNGVSVRCGKNEQRLVDINLSVCIEDRQILGVLDSRYERRSQGGLGKGFPQVSRYLIPRVCAFLLGRLRREFPVLYGTKNDSVARSSRAVVCGVVHVHIPLVAEFGELVGDYLQRFGLAISRSILYCEYLWHCRLKVFCRSLRTIDVHLQFLGPVLCRREVMAYG